MGDNVSSLKPLSIGIRKNEHNEKILFRLARPQNMRPAIGESFVNHMILVHICIVVFVFVFSVSLLSFLPQSMQIVLILRYTLLLDMSPVLLGKVQGTGAIPSFSRNPQNKTPTPIR